MHSFNHCTLRLYYLAYVYALLCTDLFYNTVVLVVFYIQCQIILKIWDVTRPCFTCLYHLLSVYCSDACTQLYTSTLDVVTFFYLFWLHVEIFLTTELQDGFKTGAAFICTSMLLPQEGNLSLPVRAAFIFMALFVFMISYFGAGLSVFTSKLWCEAWQWFLKLELEPQCVIIRDGNNHTLDQLDVNDLTGY